LVDKELDYSPYVFDKLFFVCKFYWDSLDEKSIENIIHIMSTFFKICKKDFIIEEKHDNFELNKNVIYDKYYNTLYKNSTDVKNKIKEENEILSFLFYKNFQSYYNMKYIIKLLFMNLTAGEKINRIINQDHEHILNLIAEK